MTDSFIFTGSGFVTGQYKISNNDIYNHIKSGYLDGFSDARILESENYKKEKATNANLNPFDYMVDNKMGFKTRFHVVPFPPAVPQYKLLILLLKKAGYLVIILMHGLLAQLHPTNKHLGFPNL